MQDDDELLRDLESLGQPSAPAAEPDRVVTPTADPIVQRSVDEARARIEIDKADSAAKARRESAAPVLGDWNKLDDAGKADWIKGEKEWATTSEGIWQGIHDRFVKPWREISQEMQGGDQPTFGAVGGANKLISGPFADWLQRKVTGEIASARTRQALADEMEKGKRAAPEYGRTRQMTESVATGVLDGVVANVLKGIGAATTYVSGTPMSEMDKATAYQWGEAVSQAAKAAFPGDEARQLEFGTELGQGLGSLVGFMGPALAARVALGAGNATLLAISGSTGSLATSGSMSSDAYEKFKAGATVDGRPVDDNAIAAAFILGLPIGATEAAPLASFLSGHGGKFLKRILIQAVEEGGQEWVQQVAENVVARQYYDDKREWDDNAWSGALIGGILGAKMQGAGEVWAKAKDAIRKGETVPGETKAAPVEVDQRQSMAGEVRKPKAEEKAPEPDKDVAELQQFIDQTKALVEEPTAETGGKLQETEAKSAPTEADAQLDLFDPKIMEKPATEIERAVASTYAEAGLLTEDESAAFTSETQSARTAGPAKSQGNAAGQPRAAEAGAGRNDQRGAGSEAATAGRAAGGTSVQPAKGAGGRGGGVDAQRAQLRSILAGKTASKTWAKAMGVTDAELKPMLDWAEQQGLIRRDSKGVIRRTPKAKQAETTAQQSPSIQSIIERSAAAATPEERAEVKRDAKAAIEAQIARAERLGLAVDPDRIEEARFNTTSYGMASQAQAFKAHIDYLARKAGKAVPSLTVDPAYRADRRIEAIERQTGSTIGEAAREYAVLLEQAGTDKAAFDQVLTDMRSDRAVTKPVLDEIANAYTGETKKARTKGGAFERIQALFDSRAQVMAADATTQNDGSGIDEALFAFAPIDQQMDMVRKLAQQAANDESTPARAGDMQAFVDQRIRKADSASVSVTDMYMAYSAWAEEVGAEALPLVAFKQRMASTGLTMQRIAGRDRFIGVEEIPEGERKPAERSPASAAAIENADDVVTEVRKGGTLREAISRVIDRLLNVVGIETDPEKIKANERIKNLKAMQARIANDNSASAPTFDNVAPLFAFASTPPPRTNAEGYILRLPYEDKWGDPRFNPDDRKRALEALRQIQGINVDNADWATLVVARQDLSEITRSLFYYAPDVTAEDIRKQPLWADDVTRYVDNLNRDMANMPRLTEAERTNLFDAKELPDEVLEFAVEGKRALRNLLASKRRGVVDLLTGTQLEEPKARASRVQPDKIAEAMPSGFYFEAGRKLAEVPDDLFNLGGMAVINHLTQAGVKRAEINHFQLVEKLGNKERVTREEFARAIAERMFDFKRKSMWWNPERPTGMYGFGGTRVADGPRIPGRGIYFERLLAFPKTLKGGDKFPPGYFVSPHWSEQMESTWSSWRGSLREVPEWGTMLVGEEGQTDYMQGANTGRRPKMTTAEFVQAKKDYAAYNKVIDKADIIVRDALGLWLSKEPVPTAMRRKLSPGFYGDEVSSEEWNKTLQEAREYVKIKPDTPAPDFREETRKLRLLDELETLHKENERFFLPGARKQYYNENPAEDRTPETPIDESYVRTMVRDLLLLAAKKKVDSLAISTSETTNRIQANTHTSAAHFYDNQLKPALEKELRRQTGDGSVTLEKVDLPKALGAPKRNKPYTVWAARLPTNAPSIMGEQPLFAFARQAQQDAETGQSMRRDLDALGYYSKALEAARALKQAKGTPEQMLAQLKAAGVKDAEIEATGLRPYLDGRKSITRDEIVSHLEDNRVGLTEVVRGSPSGWRDARSMELYGVPYASLRETGQRFEVMRQLDDASTQAKWSSYSLDPSNPTYRETVLHLPDRSEEQAQMRAAAKRMAELGYGNVTVSTDDAPIPPVFQSGHFPEPNIVGHMMTSMVRHEGKPVFLIDQIQSDWGQAIRDGGVRDEAKIADLRKRVDEARLAEEAAYVWPAGVAYAKARDEAIDKYGSRAAMPREVRAALDAMDTESQKSRPDRVSQTYRDAVDRLRLLQAELETAEAANLVGNPLVNTTDQWTTTTLRRAIRQAVEAEADYIAIPSGDTVLSYNPGDKNGMRQFYGDGRSPETIAKLNAEFDEEIARFRANGMEAEAARSEQNRKEIIGPAGMFGIVPKNLRAILQKIDKTSPAPQRVETLDTPTKGAAGDGFTLFPITDAVRRSVMAEGQPLFRLASEQRDLGSYRPGYVERMGEIVAGIEDEIAKVAPRDVAVRIADRLADRRSGREMEGAYLPGARLIAVSMQYGAKEARTAAWHEITHALRDAGAFTNDEWKTLLDRAAKVGMDEKISAMVPGGLPFYAQVYAASARRENAPNPRAYVKERLDQERVAYMAQEWSSGTSFGNTIDALLARMVEIMRAIKAVMERAGFTSLADVFEQAEVSGIRGRMREGMLRDRIKRETDPEVVERRAHAMAMLMPEGTAATEVWGGAMAAYSPGLDMSAEARKARAEGMGFDTGVVYFHASPSRFDAFDLAKGGGALGPSFGKGEPFFRGSEQYYLRLKNKLSFNTGFEVTPREFVRFLVDGTYHDFNGDVRPVGVEIAPADKAVLAATVAERGWSAGRAETVRKMMRTYGIDGFEFTHEMVTETIPFDPANIRSVNAEFDPSKSGSPELLAAFASQQPQTTSTPFSAANMRGSVQSQTTRDGRGQRTYRIGEDQTAATMVVTQHANGRWEVSTVRVDDQYQGKGVGAALYDAVERDLNTVLAPSGWLTDEGYKFWKKRDPESVRYHVQGGPFLDRMWLSPKQIDTMMAVMNAVAERSDDVAQISDAMEKYAELKAMRRQVPTEAYEAARLEVMFAFRLFGLRNDGGSVKNDGAPSALGAARNMPAANDEAAADVLRRNAKQFGETLVSNPLLIEGVSALDVETRRGVLSVMSGLLKDGEIAQSVVRLVPVDVMNMLAGSERSAEMLLHNPTMLVDLLSADANDAVASGIQAMDVLAPYVALAAAESALIGPESRTQLREALTARRADKGDLHIREIGMAVTDFNGPSPDSLATAKDMASRGSVPTEIAEQTGWAKDARGNWQYVGLDADMAGDGVSDTDAMFAFSKKKAERRLTIDGVRMSKRQVEREIVDWQETLDYIDEHQNDGHLSDEVKAIMRDRRTDVEKSIAKLQAALPRFDDPSLPRGKPFVPAKNIHVGPYVVRRAQDERLGYEDGTRRYTIHNAPAEGQKRVGRYLGDVSLDQHPDGRWEVSMVEVLERHRGKGVAKALYQAVEQDLGQRMQPSGILLPDGYEMWKARNPEQVRWHVPVDGGAYYLSPKKILAWIEQKRGTIEYIRRRNVEIEAGTRPAISEREVSYNIETIAALEREIVGLREKFDALPKKAKTPQALEAMFAFRAPKIKPLTEIIADLREALGMNATQGRYGLTVEGIDSGSERRFRPKPSLAGQYDNRAGTQRFKIATDIDNVAHEGGHHLWAQTDIAPNLHYLVMTAHADEMAQFEPSGNEQAAPNEAFAEWFRTYILTPDDARARAPGFTQAFEDMLDGLDPGMLEAIDRIHLFRASEEYQEYKAATDLERGRADLKSNADRTIGTKLRKFYEDIGQDGTVSGYAHRIYEAALDKAHPWYRVTAGLLNKADENGITNDADRPIALAAYQDPYKLMRSIGDSFKTGLRWIQDGMPRYREANGERSASLHDAIQLAMGGDGKKWNLGAYQDFGVYLESRRAVEEWKTWTAKTIRMAELSRKISGLTGARPALADLVRRLDGRIETRVTREIGSAALMADRRKALTAANAELRDVQRRLDVLRDELAAAEDATAVDADQRDSRIRRRQRSIAMAEQKQAEAVKRVDELTREIDEMEVGGAMDAVPLDNLRAQAEQARQRLDGLDTYVRELRAEQKDLRDNGMQRAPHRVDQATHEERLEKLRVANPTFERAAKMVSEFLWAQAQYDYAAGRLSKAEIDYRETRKDYYVPFARDISDVDAEAMGGVGSGIKRFAKDKRFTGSQRDVIHPLETIVDQTFHRAAATYFNQIVLALGNLADSAGPGGAAIAERVEKTELVEATAAEFDRIREHLVSLGYEAHDAAEMVRRIENDFADTQLLLRWQPEGFGPKRPLLLPYWENGQRKFVRVNDPELAQSMAETVSGFGRELGSVILDLVAKPAAMLRFGVTTNPAFVLPNIIRDMFSAFILTGRVTDPSTWPIATQARGLYHELAQTQMARLYQEVSGIMGGQNVAALPAVKDQADVMELEQKGLRLKPLPLLVASAAGVITGTLATGGVAGAMFGGLVGASLHRGPKRFMENMALFSDMSETATRLGVFTSAYKQALESNPSLTPYEAAQEAAFIARDVIDFGRHGSRMLAMTKLVPFMNANLQGLDKIVRQMLLARSARGNQQSVVNLAGVTAGAAVAGFAVGGPLGSALAGTAAPVAYTQLQARSEAFRRILQPWWKRNAGMQLSADDEKALADSARAWTHLALYTGGFLALMALYRDDDEYRRINAKLKAKAQPVKVGDQWMQIPKAFEFAIPSIFLEAAIDAQFKGDPNFWPRVREGLADTLGPPLSPQVVKMWGDIRGNFNSLTKRPIVPEYMKTLPPQEQFNAYTSQLAISLSKSINESWAKKPVEAVGSFMFGNKFEATPAVIDYAISSGLGYWGKDAQKASNVARETGPRSGRIIEYPLIGTIVQRFALDPDRASDAHNAFWEMMGRETDGYPRAAKGYEHYRKTYGQDRANAYLATLEDDEQRAWALVQNGTSAYQRNLHPLQRANDVLKVIRDLQGDILLDRLQDTTSRTTPVDIKLSPDKAAEARDALNTLAAIEAENALIAMKHKQFAARKVRDIQPSLELLAKIDERVAKQYETRLGRAATGASVFEKRPVADFADVQAQWPGIREKLIADWQAAGNDTAPPGARRIRAK